MEDDFLKVIIPGCPVVRKLGLKVFRSVEKKIPSPQTRGPDLHPKNPFKTTQKIPQVLSEKLDVAFRQLRVAAEGGGGFWGEGIFFVLVFLGVRRSEGGKTSR